MTIAQVVVQKGSRRAEIWHSDSRMPATEYDISRGRENQMLGFVPQGSAGCHWHASSACVTSPSAFVILEVRASACDTSHSGQVIVLLVPEHA